MTRYATITVSTEVDVRDALDQLDNERLKDECEGKHSISDVRNLMEIQRGKCAHVWCRADLSAGHHVDHIMPLSRGGLNTRQNLQILCIPCNLSKWASHPVDYALRHGMLV